GRSPLDCRNDVGAYRREIGRLTPDKFAKLPDHLVASVQSLLTANPAQRLTLQQFQGSKYFDNVLVATIRYLEAIVEQPQEQKIAFMKGLPRVLGQFPDRVLRRKVLPALIDQTNDHRLLPFTLPNVFKIVEKLSASEFVSLALPGLKPTFSILDPPQTSMVLLENLELLQKKTPAAVFKSDVMPLLYTALLSTVPQVQDKALQAVPTIAESVDYADLKDQVFPRVQHLYSKASVLSLKIRALICLHGMLKALDKGTIADKLLPMLKRTKTREAGMVMTMLVMYEEIGLKYVDKDTVAKEILPQLWVQAVESQLRVDQFDKFMGVVAKLTDKVKEEMRRQLAGLQRIEEQTANMSISGDGAGEWGGPDEGLGSNDGGFAALVNGDSGVMQNPLAQTPKASTKPMQNPLAPSPAASTSGDNSGWEWDSPTFASNPPLSPTAAKKSLGKTVPVDSDFLGSSPSASHDDFGSFGSFIPPPKGSLSAASGAQMAKNVSSRLRTTPAFGQHTGKLGATKISPGLGSGFGAIPPPPPASSSAARPPVAKPNYNIGNSFAGMQAKPMQLNSVLVPTPKGTSARDRRDSQSHAGGKASHLDDFDPFA
ncbi:Protein kinase domain-containing protein ppk32, partial [Linderina pennispora]